MVRSSYDDLKFIEREVEAGRHREIIGGRWFELGVAQLKLLQSRGLEPTHTVLDIGCGSLRGGVHLIEYLEAGRYFGIDTNEALIEAGYAIELAQAGLQSKCPRSNLICSQSFEFEAVGCEVDFGLAFSLFTHLPLNDIRTCLEKWRQVAHVRSVLYATYFEGPTSGPLFQSKGQGDGVVSFSDKDPYHYRPSDLSYIASQCDLIAEDIKDFVHPRGQKMTEYRIASPVSQASRSHL